MMERRAFLGRLGALLGLAAVAPAALAATPSAVKGPLHGEGPSFDVPLDITKAYAEGEWHGWQEPCADCGAPNALITAIEEAPRGGVAYLGDGGDDWGYEARAESPLVHEVPLCAKCRELRSMPYGLVEVTTPSPWLRGLTRSSLHVWDTRDRVYRRVVTARPRDSFAVWERRVLG